MTKKFKHYTKISGFHFWNNWKKKKNSFIILNFFFYNKRHGSKRFPNNRCLGHRPKNEKGEYGDFVWQSYSEVEKRISEFGSGLLSSETTKLEKGSHIGIYSKNRPEWVIAEQGKKRIDFLFQTNLLIFDLKFI